MMIYDKDRNIVYSTDHKIIGHINTNNKELESALKGEIVSKLETKQTVWDLADEKKTDIALVETYLPIKDKNGLVIGSFELYTDVTHYHNEIRKVMIPSAVTVFVILICVFGFMFILMRQATKEVQQLTEKKRELDTANALAQMERKKASELAKAYEELKQTQKMLIQSEKMSAVGQLSAGIAHDFNNILAIIKGNSQLSLISSSVKEIKKSLEIINKSVNRGKELVKNLQIFAQPKKPKKQINDISKVINEVYLLQKKQLSLENITIIKEYHKHSNISFDWGQMEQVFGNLFINARHAMLNKKKGTISISIKDIDNMVEIRFSDSGIGISKQDIEKIFNPFFTTKSAYAKDGLKIEGTGLGLSVTYSIIQQHKGKIIVKSEKEKGTTFIITLPIVESKQKPTSQKIIKKQKTDLKKIKHLKILIIDDEEEIIAVLKRILERKRFINIKIKKSGKSALNLLKTFKPDVIFLDIMMPDMDGEQCLKEIKKMRIKAPVVLISGKLGLNKNTLKRKGAFDLIEKPFDVEDVFRVLNKVVKGEKREKT